MDLHTEIINAFFYIIAYFLILLIVILFKRILPGKKELLRKIAHILICLGAIPSPYLIKSHWTLLILVFLLEVSFLMYRTLNYFKDIFDVKRKTFGDLFLPPAFYLLYLVGKGNPSFHLASLLVLAISDVVVVYIGKRLGRIRVSFWGNQKSLEGSLAFFASSFFLILLPLLFMEGKGWGICFSQTIFTAFGATLFEFFSPLGSDNLTIPLSTYYLLLLTGSLSLSPWLGYSLLGLIGVFIIIITIYYLVKGHYE